MNNAKETHSARRIRRMPYIVLLALCGLLSAFGSDTARALDEVSNRQVVYRIGNRCLWASASLRANGFGPGESGGGDTLSMYGFAWESTKCTSGSITTVYNAPGDLAVRYTLWKWNGTTSEICYVSPWRYNQSSDSHYAYISGRQGQWIADQACGDGWYNLGVDAYVRKNGVWSGSTMHSGWLWADVNNNWPPIVW